MKWFLVQYFGQFLGQFRLIFSSIYKCNFREKECGFRNNFTPVLEGNRCSIFFPCESFDISQRPNRFWEAIEMPDFFGEKASDKVVRIHPKYKNLKSTKKTKFSWSTTTTIKKSIYVLFTVFSIYKIILLSNWI